MDSLPPLHEHHLLDTLCQSLQASPFQNSRRTFQCQSLPIHHHSISQIMWYVFFLSTFPYLHIRIDFLGNSIQATTNNSSLFCNNVSWIPIETSPFTLSWPSSPPSHNKLRRSELPSWNSIKYSMISRLSDARDRCLSIVSSCSPMRMAVFPTSPIRVSKLS